MDTVVLLIVLALTVDGFVEYTKTLLAMDWKAAAIQLGALAAAVLLCVLAEANLYGWLGINTLPPLVGCILSGIPVSRGANYTFDFLKRVRNGGNQEIILENNSKETDKTA